ncbi:hypothetical protein Dimus_031701 [Dionaea muscipula]
MMTAREGLKIVQLFDYWKEDIRSSSRGSTTKTTTPLSGSDSGRYKVRGDFEQVKDYHPERFDGFRGCRGQIWWCSWVSIWPRLGMVRYGILYQTITTNAIPKISVFHFFLYHYDTEVFGIPKFGNTELRYGSVMLTKNLFRGSMKDEGDEDEESPEMANYSEPKED